MKHVIHNGGVLIAVVCTTDAGSPVRSTHHGGPHNRGRSEVEGVVWFMSRLPCSWPGHHGRLWHLHTAACMCVYQISLLTYTDISKPVSVWILSVVICRRSVLTHLIYSVHPLTDIWLAPVPLSCNDWESCSHPCTCKPVSYYVSSMLWNCAHSLCVQLYNHDIILTACYCWVIKGKEIEKVW